MGGGIEWVVEIQLSVWRGGLSFQEFVNTVDSLVLEYRLLKRYDSLVTLPALSLCVSKLDLNVPEN